jgi:CRISPR/Cas system-associated protein Cas10 (large subunit of type III CRISPR-Cas system)
MDSDFFYCPWCGESAASGGMSDDIAARIDTVCDELSTMQSAWTGSRLVRMDAELGIIERELSALLSGTKTP